MSIDVIPLTGDRLDEYRDQWERCVERSPEANLFHQLEALSVLERHADATVLPLLGLNGNEPVGAFPVFESAATASRLRPGGDATVVRSPPHLLKNFPLGPATANLEKMKRRRRERYRTEFVEGCLEAIREHLDPAKLHVRTDVEFEDARPFTWNGLDAKPYYTYEVDLDREPDEIIGGFSRGPRNDIRSADPDRYEIEEGDADDAAFVIEQVRDRYAEQGEHYRLTTAFVRELYERLPDGQVRPYVCSVDGERNCGIVAFEFGDRAYRWQGGVRTDVDLPTSDLLDWHVMQRAAERDRTTYDLVGANKRRLCEYKSKFGPELREYYNVYDRDNVATAVGGVRTEVSAAVDDVRNDITAAAGTVRTGVGDLWAALPAGSSSADGTGDDRRPERGTADSRDS